MKNRNRAIRVFVLIIFIGMVSAVALYWSLSESSESYLRLGTNLESTSDRFDPEGGLQPSQKVWNTALCRARIYLQKARGEVPDLSWAELWELVMHRNSGLHCMEGRSLEANFQYSSNATGADLKSGARIFHEQCTGCHGDDGSGGPHGPPLTRNQFEHGDSDLAIYEILRDGIPGTAMPSAGRSLPEILQVVAFVKSLRVHPPEDYKDGTTGRAIQASSERLRASEANPGEWLTYSGSYNGWRHSSLAEITPTNVAQLKIRWIRQFDRDLSPIEATPLVIDDVLFMAVSSSNAAALNAKTGDPIWQYRRQIPTNLPLCCGRVNRGLAAHDNTIFFGTLDGYLVALNATDGRLVWQTPVAMPSDGYSITGAPLVVNHSVVVGVAGGDFGARGFLAAFDVLTGRQQWKFETIPGPGEAGHETWENDAWRTGGGATWNTGSYDPSTDLLYWGVGNPSPGFSGDVRPGDNLFTSSVIALHASTGKLVWHFQFSPHDEHDWDSTQTPILADLAVNGKIRKAICWPNRNGFYYVLDRVTGEFLIGTPFVEVDWASGLTSAGRPIPSDAATAGTGHRTSPGVSGATNWQNPSFDQKRGYIFVPTTVSSSVFTKSPPNRVTRERTGMFLGSGSSSTEPVSRLVRALDAATGERKWEYNPKVSGVDFSGLLSTDGGLVFGASSGVIFALDADTGGEVWRLPLGGTTWGAPISFTLDGRQVIAVTAGRALFVFGL
jgi:alcohol dehydrogenase (cytochrome c)